jgi:hypothetical protein
MALIWNSQKFSVKCTQCPQVEGGTKMKLCHFSTASLVCKEGLANFYFFITFREFACSVANLRSDVEADYCQRLHWAEISTSL